MHLDHAFCLKFVNYSANFYFKQKNAYTHTVIITGNVNRRPPIVRSVVQRIQAQALVAGRAGFPPRRRIRRRVAGMVLRRIGKPQRLLLVVLEVDQLGPGQHRPVVLCRAVVGVVVEASRRIAVVVLVVRTPRLNFIPCFKPAQTRVSFLYILCI